MSFDGKAFGREIVSMVKDYVAAETRPLVERIKQLEARPAPVGIADAIKSSDGILILTLTDGRTIDTGIRDGVKGADAEPLPDIAAMVAEAVEKEASRLAEAKPEPQPVTLSVDEITLMVDEKIQQKVSADVAKAMEAVSTQIEERVAAIPKPQAGKSVTVDDVRPLIREEVSAAVAALPVPKDGRDGIDGKDGIGLAGFFLDKDFNVVATTSDGTVHNLGCVKGEKGDPGRDGKDGMDGVSMSHFDTEMKDERTIVFKFVRDDSIVEMHEFSFPVLIDRGVWTERVYQKGDCVTWGGSLWICQRETSAKPDSPDSGWRLAVKKGRDGRDKA